MSIRREPIHLGQGTLHCEDCGQLLAIVDEVAGQTCITYLWRVNDDTPPAKCHGRGLNEYAAHSAYRSGDMDSYEHATITEYTWPDRDLGEEMPELDEEPWLETPTEAEQLAMEAT